jgi:hypothetical protein
MTLNYSQYLSKPIHPVLHRFDIIQDQKLKKKARSPQGGRHSRKRDHRCLTFPNLDAPVQCLFTGT